MKWSQLLKTFLAGGAVGDRDDRGGGQTRQLDDAFLHHMPRTLRAVRGDG